MPNVVALSLSGPAFVRELTKIWDDGDAVLPIDPRWPAPTVARLFEQLRPGAIVDGSGRRTLAGAPGEAGDAVVIATSGTTGDPRGVVLTFDAVKASAAASADRLGSQPDDHWLACLPLSHIGGFSVVARAVLAGTALTVHERFDAAAVEASEATLVSLVPTTLSRVRTDRFRAVLLGGAAAAGALPGNVVRTYGLTETGSGVVYDGRVLDRVELALRDVDGTVGRIAVRGPMLLRAYRDGTTPLDEHGWLITNDLGSLDVDGALHIHGRVDDVINSGGEKVWPDLVECILTAHRSIAEAAVIGVTDAEWGQRVVAVLVGRAGTDRPSLAELRDLVRAELPVAAAPRQLWWVDELPRTAIGKLRRAELRDRWRSAFEQTL